MTATRATVPERSSVIAETAHTAWSHVVATQPYFALRCGSPVHALPHGSLDEAARDAAVGRSIRTRLRDVDPAGLDAADRNTLALLDHIAAEWSAAEDRWWWHFPAAPYQTYEFTLYGQQVLRSFTAADAADVDRYLALATDVAAWARCARQKLISQADHGWPVPRAALDGFVATMRAHRDGTGTWLQVDESATRQLSAADRGRLRDGVHTIVDDEVLPAFDEVLEYLTGPAARTAVDGVGLARYPGGDEAYRQLVRGYATFDITPERVHELGLEQVARLTEQMAALRAEAGFDGDEHDYRRVLEADARFHASSPDEVADTYRRHLGAVEPVVGRWFHVLPQAEYGVERLDPALEPGMSFGYYEPPTPQHPVGRYRYNGSGLDSRAQINAAALILHELVPGHHFHLARQAEDTGLHPIRSELAPMMLGAYTEGWAEYAASLGFEMGTYADPWDRYGSFLHQRFVAQRLVVDTGLNLHGWSLDKARGYMAATTMESAQQIHTETLRYATDMPGQALGYRLGWRKLWQLRERAADALGAAFDVRDFHEIVLGAGALPLSAVEDNVDRYIAATRQAGPTP